MTYIPEYLSTFELGVYNLLWFCQQSTKAENETPVVKSSPSVLKKTELPVTSERKACSEGQPKTIRYVWTKPGKSVSAAGYKGVGVEPSSTTKTFFYYWDICMAEQASLRVCVVYVLKYFWDLIRQLALTSHLTLTGARG